jgi:hypothetical protein
MGSLSELQINRTCNRARNQTRIRTGEEGPLIIIFTSALAGYYPSNQPDHGLYRVKSGWSARWMPASVNEPQAFYGHAQKR